MAWIRFKYDPEYACQHWSLSHIGPSDDLAVEVPDHVVRRWNMVWDLFVEVQIEAGEWKGRLWTSRALPTRLTPMEIVDDNLDDKVPARQKGPRYLRDPSTIDAAGFERRPLTQQREDGDGPTNQADAG